MRTAQLPLSDNDQTYVAVIPNGDGTATLYDSGDELPPGMAQNLANLESLILAIDSHANSLRENATYGITSAEMASWSIKRAEALAYQSNSNADDAPTLALEALARNVPLQDLVTRVLFNAARMSALEASIAGTAGRHKDAIRAFAFDDDGWRFYDWSTHWPVLT